MSKSECAVCGKIITWRFGLCEECGLKYGKRAPEQPAWVRFMRADKEKERRFWAKVKAHEVPMSILRGEDAD